MIEARHIEVSLPEGATYKEGDHLGVLPVNSEKNINRILKRFGLNGKDQVILSASGRSINHIPLDSPVSLIFLVIVLKFKKLPLEHKYEKW